MNLEATVEQTVAGLGYELVDIEFAGRGLLRITIDWPFEKILEHTAALKKNEPTKVLEPWDTVFVNVEDCEKVSRQLSYLFTVENVEYTRLEISTPGLDRPLKKSNDFVRFAGQEVKMRLRAPIGGRRNFEGVLSVLEDGSFGLDWDEEPKKRVSKKAADSAAEKRAKVSLANAKKRAEAGVEALSQDTSASSKDTKKELVESSTPVPPDTSVDDAITKRLSFVFEDVDRANLVPLVIFNRSGNQRGQKK